MASGVQGDSGAVEVQRFAIANRLRSPGEIVAVTQPHQIEGFARCQHGAVARPRVIGVGVGNERPRDRCRRVDMKTAGFAVQPGGRGCEKLVGTHRGRYV